MKTAYVILHYNTFELTRNALLQLREIMSPESEAVIVDNNSSNKSGRELEEYFAADKRFHFLFVTEDIGFARGNNIGYEYAKTVCGARCIVVMNNDVFIYQKNFEQELENSSTIGAVIAPRITTAENLEQNPYRLKPVSTLLIAKFMFTRGFELLLTYTALHGKLFRKKPNCRKVCEETLYNIVPHGSCVIFTEEYIRQSDFAFVPITYFYGEEDILFDYLQRKGLTSVYVPRLQVIHRERGTTDTMGDTAVEKRRFVLRRRMYSQIIRLRYRIFGK